jgi:hypothetical protein
MLQRRWAGLCTVVQRAPHSTNLLAFSAAAGAQRICWMLFSTRILNSCVFDVEL